MSLLHDGRVLPLNQHCLHLGPPPYSSGIRVAYSSHKSDLHPSSQNVVRNLVEPTSLIAADAGLGGDRYDLAGLSEGLSHQTITMYV